MFSNFTLFSWKEIQFNCGAYRPLHYLEQKEAAIDFLKQVYIQDFSHYLVKINSTLFDMLN